MGDKSRALHQTQLAEVFRFTKEDLAANREGYISPNQLGTIRGKLNIRLSFVYLLLVAGAFPFAIWGRDAIVFTISAVIIAAVMFISFKDLSPLRQDLHAKFINSVEGVIRVETEPPNVTSDHHYARFVIYIGKERLETDEREGVAFMSGEPYRIYYAPYSRTILAVEWLNASSFE